MHSQRHSSPPRPKSHRLQPLLRHRVKPRRSFDRSATKIQAASDPSHVVSPRSPSTPPPRNQEASFVGFPSHFAKESGVNPPDATQAPSDAATQSSVVRTRIDEPPISSSTLKVVATPTDLAFGIESKQASPPATMNSVAAFASQLGGIQAQFGVSSASLNTTLAAVSHALPLPINDIATAAAHYVKAQLLSAGPSSFSNLGTACLQSSAFVCFLTNILLANRRSQEILPPSKVPSRPKRNTHKSEPGRKRSKTFSLLQLRRKCSKFFKSQNLDAALLCLPIQ